MKKISFAVIAAFGLMSGAVSAQGLSGAVTFSGGSSKLSGVPGSANSLGLSGEISTVSPSGFTFDAMLDAGRLKEGGFSLNHTALGVGFGWTDGMTRGGVYADHHDLELGVLGDTLPVGNLQQFGLEGGYRSGDLDLSGFLGTGDDFTSYGAALQYAVAPGAVIGGHLTQSKLSSGGVRGHLTSAGIAGGYSFSNNFGVFAGLSRTSSPELEGHVNFSGLGAHYVLPTQQPVALSLELRSASAGALGLGGDKLTSTRLGVTIPFGERSSVMPRNSLAHNILNPKRNTLGQTLQNLY